METEQDYTSKGSNQKRENEQLLYEKLQFITNEGTPSNAPGF